MSLFGWLAIGFVAGGVVAFILEARDGGFVLGDVFNAWLGWGLLGMAVSGTAYWLLG